MLIKLILAFGLDLIWPSHYSRFIHVLVTVKMGKHTTPYILVSCLGTIFFLLVCIKNSAYSPGPLSYGSFRRKYSAKNRWSFKFYVWLWVGTRLPSVSTRCSRVSLQIPEILVLIHEGDWCFEGREKRRSQVNYLRGKVEQWVRLHLSENKLRTAYLLW